MINIIKRETTIRITKWLVLHENTNEIVNLLEKHNIPNGVVKRYDEIESGCIPTISLKYIDQDGNLWDWS